MESIDAHQHFWDLSKFDYLRKLERSYFPKDLIPSLGKVGVKGTVIVQAHDSFEETLWLIELAEKLPFVKGIVAWVDLTSPDVAPELSIIVARSKKVKGIRHMVEHEEDERWLLREKVVRNLKRVAEYDLPFDLLVRTPHLPYVRELAGQVPDLRMVINHMAKPPVKDHQLEPWSSEIAKVAREIPEIRCKVSGLVTEADWANWKIEDLKPFVARAVEVFGLDRLLWASDWPVCLLAKGVTYENIQNIALEAIGPISTADQEKFLSRNASEFYRL
jgi:L-fuconolactonase